MGALGIVEAKWTNERPRISGPESTTNKRANLSIRHRCKFHIDRHLSFQLAFRSLSMSLLAFTIFKKSYGPWTMVLRNFKKKSRRQ